MMNKEQPPTIEQEKEPTLEDIKRRFEEEVELYESLVEKSTDAHLKEQVGDRREILIGHKDEEDKRVPGLIEKFENKDYEECLAYLEKEMGHGSAVSGSTNTLDLINYREYGPHIHRDRSEDIKSKEYQEKKSQLRKLTDILAGEVYKEELEEKPSLKTKELLEVLGRVARLTDRDLPQMEKEVGEGNYKEIFEFFDTKTYYENSQIERARKEEKEQEIKFHQKQLFQWRRRQRYFLNLEKEKRK